MAIRRVRLRDAGEPSLFVDSVSDGGFDLADSSGDIRLHRGWRRKMYDCFVDVPRENKRGSATIASDRISNIGPRKIVV